MYSIIENFIDHTWISGTYTPGDQTYIYVFSLIILVVMLVEIIDLVQYEEWDKNTVL